MNIDNYQEDAGRLLFTKSGITPYLIIFSLAFGLLLVAAALFIIIVLKAWDKTLSWILLFIGCLVLIPFISGCMKQIDCYQRGIIIRRWWKQDFISFKDICAVRYYALTQYSSGLNSGTACVLEIVPLHSKTIKFDVFGTEKDSQRVWELVHIIKNINPSVELVQYWCLLAYLQKIKNYFQETKCSISKSLLNPFWQLTLASRLKISISISPSSAYQLFYPPPASNQLL